MGVLGDILLDQYRRGMDRKDLARLAAIQQLLTEGLPEPAAAPSPEAATALPALPAPATRRLSFRDREGHPTMGVPAAQGWGAATRPPAPPAPVAAPAAARQEAGSRMPQQFERAAIMARLGLDPEALAAPTYFDFIKRVQAGEPVNAVLGDFLNRKSIAPYGLSGGVVYGKYGGDIADESSQVRAAAAANMARAGAARAQAGVYGQRARLYGQQADEAALRRGAIEEALSDPTLPLMRRVDIAQKKQVGKPLMDTAIVDGKEVMVEGIPQPDGSIRWRPAMMDDEPLTVPLGAADDFRQVMPPVAAWSEARKRAAAAAQYRWGRLSPEEQQRATVAEYQASFPGWPLPGEPGFEQGNPLAPGRTAAAPVVQEWQGQSYRVGQIIIGADGQRGRVAGFYPDGEPRIEAIE